ncbi:hypothetical protein IFM89_027389 [Coptis chinensis]|uniref:Aminotransferase class V domain-containing protein n=1 Tax=Coptis chinensis TaxID=261450 RepID=A0A835LFZ3_9MAGN|nr:hypothetical protein IFM89_027389 [Coptis chinensis]
MSHMCGPTGAGFLYGKSKVLSGMPPFLGGGEMISDVFLDHSTYANPPPSRPLLLIYLPHIGQMVRFFQYGVAIRSGHHCAQPLHRYLGINASVRASLHFYNTKEDVDTFIRVLKGTIDP